METPFLQKHQEKFLIVGVLLLLALIGFTIWRIVKSVKDAQKTAKYPQYQYILDPTTGQLVPTTNPTAGYNPEPLAQKLVDRLTDWCFYCKNRCAAYDEALHLTDNQLLAVAYEFQRKHPQRYSLRQAIRETERDGCLEYDPFGTDYQEALSARLLRLNLP